MCEQHNARPKRRQTINYPLYRPLLTDRNELVNYQLSWVTLF